MTPFLLPDTTRHYQTLPDTTKHYQTLTDIWIQIIALIFIVKLSRKKPLYILNLGLLDTASRDNTLSRNFYVSLPVNKPQHSKRIPLWEPQTSQTLHIFEHKDAPYVANDKRPTRGPRQSLSLSLALLFAIEHQRTSGVPRNFFGGVQQIQLSTEDREDGDLGAVAP